MSFFLGLVSLLLNQGDRFFVESDGAFEVFDRAVQSRDLFFGCSVGAIEGLAFGLFGLEGGDGRVAFGLGFFVELAKFFKVRDQDRDRLIGSEVVGGFSCSRRSVRPGRARRGLSNCAGAN